MKVHISEANSVDIDRTKKSVIYDKRPLHTTYKVRIEQRRSSLLKSS